MTTVETTPFGRALRHWRRLRGISQLDLAAAAATTTRHLSFLETGRSRPSRQMVERLGDALAIPLRERNRLLQTAGLAPAYPEGDIATEDLAPFRRVIARLLETHEPYPAFVIDRHWNVVASNRAAALFLPADHEEANTVMLLMRQWSGLIENWAEVVGALADRIAADLMRFPDDDRLRELHAYVLDSAGQHNRRTPAGPGTVLCPRFRIDGQLVRTLTVVAQFESAADITLDELRVELVYPQDDASERFFQDRLRAG